VRLYFKNNKEEKQTNETISVLGIESRSSHRLGKYSSISTMPPAKGLDFQENISQGMFFMYLR
jgi:hypothetical protein